MKLGMLALAKANGRSGFDRNVIRCHGLHYSLALYFGGLETVRDIPTIFLVVCPNLLCL